MYLRPTAQHVFSPYDLKGGPGPETLGPVRATQMISKSIPGEKIYPKTEHHRWRDPHWTKAKTRSRWTGKSIFSKLGQQTESAELPSGIPLQPDSTEGRRTSLAGLCTQLAESQRRNPRLKEIIVALRGLPKGTYHRDTFRSDVKRIKARMCKYRLASDGGLVSQLDDVNYMWTAQWYQR